LFKKIKKKNQQERNARFYATFVLSYKLKVETIFFPSELPRMIQAIKETWFTGGRGGGGGWLAFLYILEEANWYFVVDA